MHVVACALLQVEELMESLSILSVSHKKSSSEINLFGLKLGVRASHVRHGGSHSHRGRANTEAMGLQAVYGHAGLQVCLRAMISLGACVLMRRHVQ
jgi:hypothetical protein